MFDIVEKSILELKYCTFGRTSESLSSSHQVPFVKKKKKLFGCAGSQLQHAESLAGAGEI